MLLSYTITVTVTYTNYTVISCSSCSNWGHSHLGRDQCTCTFLYSQFFQPPYILVMELLQEPKQQKEGTWCKTLFIHTSSLPFVIKRLQICLFKKTYMYASELLLIYQHLVTWHQQKASNWIYLYKKRISCLPKPKHRFTSAKK